MHSPAASAAPRTTESAFSSSATTLQHVGQVVAPAISLRQYIITILLMSYAWESVEHYLEADSWSAVMFWMQGVEFWGNRTIADPAAVLSGALVYRFWGTPRFVMVARTSVAIWLSVHVLIFDDSMVIQRMLPSFGSVFGDKTTAWTDVWTFDHFMSGVSIGSKVVPARK